MSKYRIRGIKYPQWVMPLHELYECLGVQGNKLPDEGVPARIIQGVVVWVVPRAQKTQFIRTFCICPGCQRTLTVKCLDQHKCEAKPRNRSLKQRRKYFEAAARSQP